MKVIYRFLCKNRHFQVDKIFQVSKQCENG